MFYNKGSNDLKGEEYNAKVYKTWNRMLERCYSQIFQKNNPSYVGCSVCEDWLTFSKFKAWMETQDWEGKQLDKDLLLPGNKVYSPETCVFISKELNLFLTERNSLRGKYPIGVNLDKTSGLYLSTCSSKGKKLNLGRFKTPEQAHKAWLSKKLELARDYASLEKNVKIAQAIVRRYETFNRDEWSN